MLDGTTPLVAYQMARFLPHTHDKEVLVTFGCLGHEKTPYDTEINKPQYSRGASQERPNLDYVG
jgi:hypothetical protein